MAALSGREPFIVHPDGLGWLYAPSGVVDGPLPTHYEPQESPFENPLYGQQQNPARQLYYRKENLYNPEQSSGSSRTCSRATGSPSTTRRAGCRAP